MQRGGSYCGAARLVPTGYIRWRQACGTSETSWVEVDEVEIKRRFARNLRSLREQAGYSQENFAAHAGFNRDYYGALERGEHSPTLISIVRASRGLEVEPTRLIDGIA